MNSPPLGESEGALTDHLGNVRALFSKSDDNASLEGYTDYYPYGMPMPDRQMQDANQYRYAFQGQEKDTETGKEAFELRLWDSRIGRWLSTDPYGQYASPYLGMGNNPVSRIDPDGGFDWKKDKDGNYVYDSNLTAENASYLLGEGETYLGEDYFETGVVFLGESGTFHNLLTGERGLALDTGLSEVVLSPNTPRPVDVLGSPVGDAQISSLFLAQRDCQNCSRTHGGTDYAVSIGTPVNATANGTVARSYYSRTYGNTVIIDHGVSSSNDGTHVFTLYAHGSSRTVNERDQVTTGQQVMLSGNTGLNTTGPHLHYEVIQTHLSPHDQGFFRNLNIRRAPSELENLISN